MRRKRAGLAFALALLAMSNNLAAQDLTKNSAPSAWILGLSRFIQLPPATLAGLDAASLTLERVGELAAASAQGVLDRTFPALLASALEPLPKRAAKDRDGKPLKVTARLDQSGNDLRFAEIQTGSDALKGLDALVAGFYSLVDGRIECRVLLFARGEEEAAIQPSSLSFSGTIPDLDTFAGKLLPGILAWVAGSEIGIVDVKPEPGQGVTLALEGSPPQSGIGLEGLRVFVYEDGEYGIVLKKKGFADARRSLVSTLGSYRSLPVTLEPLGKDGSPASGEAIFSAAEALGWTEKSRFIEAERKFSAALGRFVISIPISALALGGYFSFSEAFSRSAVSPETLSWSGAGALLSVSLSAAFIVDSALRLVDVLHASR